MSVFQAESLFTNHQNLICQSKERAFKLIQTHYECKWCNLCCGTQVEYTVENVDTTKFFDFLYEQSLMFFTFRLD